MLGEKYVIRKLLTSENDGHYPGYLINGARITDYFDDVVHELINMAAGNGRIRSYKDIQFTFPVWQGDTMEYQGWIERVEGNIYEIHLEALKIKTFTDDFKVHYQFGHVSIQSAKLRGYEGPEVLDPPIICGSAVAFVEVVPDEYFGPADPKYSVE